MTARLTGVIARMSQLLGAGRNEDVEPAQAVSLTLAGNGARRGLVTLPFFTFTRRNTATISSRLQATAPSCSARRVRGR